MTRVDLIHFRVYYRYIITAGAITALCATLLGSMLPQVSSLQLGQIVDDSDGIPLQLFSDHESPFLPRTCKNM